MFTLCRRSAYPAPMAGVHFIHSHYLFFIVPWSSQCPAQSSSSWCGFAKCCARRFYAMPLNSAAAFNSKSTQPPSQNTSQHKERVHVLWPSSVSCSLSLSLTHSDSYLNTIYMYLCNPPATSNRIAARLNTTQNEQHSVKNSVGRNGIQKATHTHTQHCTLHIIMWHIIKSRAADKRPFVYTFIKTETLL